MTQTEDAYAQLLDHVAGTLYDVASAGEEEDNDLYEAFEEIAKDLLRTFNVIITETDPFEATITIKR